MQESDDCGDFAITTGILAKSINELNFKFNCTNFHQPTGDIIMNDRKRKKIELIIDIYNEFLPQKEGIKHRAFRKLVVDEITNRYGIVNKGTLGCYFAWAETMITGRKTKFYNITAPRAKSKTRGKSVNELESMENGAVDQSELNKLANLHAKNTVSSNTGFIATI